MNIKYILEIYVSNPNFAGNTYPAFIFTNADTGKSVKGKTSSGSGENINGAIYYLNGNQHIQNTRVSRINMKIRDFNRFTKDWPYVSCASDDIAKLLAQVTVAGPTEQRLNEMGDKLALVLRMRKDTEHEDRWQTSIGSKTGLGLVRTLKLFIERIENGENPF